MTSLAVPSSPHILTRALGGGIRRTVATPERSADTATALPSPATAGTDSVLPGARLGVSNDAGLDAELDARMIRAAVNNSAAFEAIYRRHYAAVVASIYRRTGDAHASEDIAAETFLSAMRHLPRYRTGDVPLRFWLLRIASNAASRWARGRRRELRRIEAISRDALRQRGQAADDDGTAGVALRALHRLSPEHQTVIWLHHLEDLSIDEISRVLGVRPGTVKSRLKRARDEMRARLPNSGATRNSGGGRSGEAAS